MHSGQVSTLLLISRCLLLKRKDDKDLPHNGKMIVRAEIKKSRGTPEAIIPKQRGGILNFREANNDGKNGALMSELATSYISKMHSMK